jgi:hypothetical protein
VKYFHLLAFAGLLTATGCAALTDEKGSASATDPSVQEKPEPLYYWGTGFFVDWNGHVLTARHLVTDCADIQVVGDGRTVPASVVAASGTDDLALLDVGQTFGQPARFDGRDSLPGGTLVTIMGYAPLIEALLTRDPKQPVPFNGLLLDEPAERQIALVSDASPGASGSPVIDRDGLVIAVLASKETRTARSGLAGRASEIRLAVNGPVSVDFLRANGISPREGDDPHTAMPDVGALAAVEVKVECRRQRQLLADDESQLP